MRTSIRSALADPATIAAVLTGLGVGGLVGAWANAWHERREKFRELTIEACVDFLHKHDVAQEELHAAQVLLFSRRSGAPTISAEAGSTELASANERWRELQSQAFRLSLLFRGGLSAPASRDAAAVVILYSRWLQTLADSAAGLVAPDATEEVASAYSGYAIEYYNDFARHANEAIRPSFATLLVRRRQVSDAADFDRRLRDLDAYARSVRARNQEIETHVDESAEAS